MEKFKKLLCIMLVFLMLGGNMSVIAITYNSYNWSDSSVYVTNDGRGMPFFPGDKYISQQNPPSFTWPYVTGALSYELNIYTDKALSAIEYSKSGITNNFYNFDTIFKTGIDYYWTVKYIKSNGKSEESEARRFRIDPDATEFAVPPIDELLKKVPENHPRIWVTEDTLEEFRLYKDKYPLSKDIYDLALNNAEKYMKSYEIKTFEQAQENSSLILSNLEVGFTCAFVYLVNPSRKDIGRFATNCILSYADWDPVYGPGGSKNGDDAYAKRIMCFSAYAYDWLYPLLLEDCKNDELLNMVVERFKTFIDRSNYLTSIKKDPYDSHGWSIYGSMMSTALAIYGDTNETYEWFKSLLEGFTAIYPCWSGQDGGWSQGTGYSRYARRYLHQETGILARAGIIDFSDTAWAKNSYLWTLYVNPYNGWGSFGDEGYGAKNVSYDIFELVDDIYFIDDEASPTRKWMLSKLGEPNKTDYETALVNYWKAATYENYEENAKKPTDYPLAHKFSDVGWAVMTNDLVDADRILLTFKSSPYGSFNHSLSDQNSFFIEAFGEPLAVRTGYYDSYHSMHDKYITRATFSHNSITVDGGKGQAFNNFNAKGNISQFVNGLEFDSVTGEAQNAYRGGSFDDTYNGLLDRFDRSIIYIRPDVFVVIDDLDANGENSSSFEWWLNAENTIEYTNEDGNNSALLNKGEARLKAQLTFPRELKASYYDTFYNPVTDTEYAPTKYTTSNIQKRVSFATEKTDKTKMIVSMSVYKASGIEKSPYTEYGEDYVKMTYSDGTVVIVSLRDKSETVSVDDITFAGTTVTLSDTTIMLTNGSYLKKGEKELIKSDKDITASMGLGQLCISGDDDYNAVVEVMNDYLKVTDLYALKDQKNRSITSATGISVSKCDENLITLSAQKGSYTIINGAQGGQLKVEDMSIQKSRDGKVALLWKRKNGREYDIKINGEIHVAETSPYIFEAVDGVQCVYLREKIGDIKGEWSEPLYISSYEKETHDKIRFSETDQSIIAETFGDSSFNFLDMYLGQYNKEGTLIHAVKAIENNSVYSASVPKYDNGIIKAFMFGENITPLAATAEYGNDSTDLLGIYIDGKLIKGFDNTKNEYEYNLEGDRDLFPYVTATPADNASDVVVKYNFDELYAIVNIVSQKGTKRTVKLKFLTEPHAVKGATEVSDFVKDNTLNVHPDGVQPQKSKTTVGVLSYKDSSGDTKYSKCNIYTNFRENAGGNCFGSRIYSGLSPNSGNHMEFYDITDDLKDCDYFAFDSDICKYIKTNGYTDISFSFELEKPAKIIVLTTSAMDTLNSYGFKKDITSNKARYMNPPGAEDKYYNLKFNNRTINDFDTSYWLSNYDILPLWVNVEPLDGYAISTGTDSFNNSDLTYKNYIDKSPKKEAFTLNGNGTKFVHTSGYSFNTMYSKYYQKGEKITIDFSDMKTFEHRAIVLVKNIPYPFYTE